MIDLDKFEVWFVTGSQHLYGPETLKQVNIDSKTIADAFDDFAYFHDLIGIQSGGRLIQYQNFRVVHHGVGQPDTLFVALGKFSDGPVHDLVDAAKIGHLPNTCKFL